MLNFLTAFQKIYLIKKYHNDSSILHHTVLKQFSSDNVLYLNITCGCLHLKSITYLQKLLVPNAYDTHSIIQLCQAINISLCNNNKKRWHNLHCLHLAKFLSQTFREFGAEKCVEIKI